MSETIYLIYAFIGSFSFGLTAILLKIGMEKPNIFQGMVIRGLGSIPLLILLNLYTNGFGFYKVYIQFDILILVTITSILLLLADVLLLHILSKKSVGVIAPIIAINPIFTTMLLLVTKEVVVTIEIIVLTIIIVFGVFLVTIKTNNSKLSLKSAFDIEALRYGIAIAVMWGIMNYLDIIVLNKDEVEGISYSAIKFTIVSIISLVVVVIHRFNASESDPISIKSKSFRYMLIAGFVGWVAGSVLVYTAYERGNVAQINPIVGLNPLFAIVLSIILKQESMTKVKLLGIMLSVSSSILLVT